MEWIRAAWSDGKRRFRTAPAWEAIHPAAKKNRTRVATINHQRLGPKTIRLGGRTWLEDSAEVSSKTTPVSAIVFSSERRSFWILSEISPLCSDDFSSSVLSATKQ